MQEKRTNEVTVRIVYDGTPLAGKTTSLRALSHMLARARRSELFTPCEAEGRTLYFDWLDYLGGWLDGRPVRFQIVTVPGQRALAERRELLVQDADVVILVAESTASGMEAASLRVEELRARLERQDEPLVPVVVQANKQDLPGSLPLDAMRKWFSGPGLVPIVPSRATDGEGVREAFTFAARLALDRVRELIRRDRLAQSRNRVASGEELLEWLETEERSSSEGTPNQASRRSSVPEPQREPVRSQRTKPQGVRAGSQGEPALPSSSVPSGLVWPPMIGRMVLHELESAEIRLERNGDNSWTGRGPPAWVLSSGETCVYADIETGRAALLGSARLHASLGSLLSEHRAVVLSETGTGSWRLWTVARLERSLRALLDDFLAAPRADELLALAEKIVEAAEQLARAPVPLQFSLSDVGWKDGRAFYTGLIADNASVRDRPEPAELLYRELGLHLEQLAEMMGPRVTGLLKEISRAVAERPEWAPLAEPLSLILIGK